MTATALIALVPRLAVSAVFAVAGLSKLADLRGSRRSLQDFGVPARFSHGLGLALPIVELVVAIVLVPPSTAVYGAMASLLLLVIFVAAIGWSLIHGRRPPCHCFGQLSSAPLGPSVLVRNALLALLSLVIIWQASNPSTDSRAPAVAAGVLVALVVANFGRGFVTEWRTSLADGTGVAQDAGQTPMASLAAGSQAPSFALRSLGGETVSLARLLDPGLPAVIVFSDPDCGPCSALLPKIAEWQREFAAQLTLAIVSRGTPEANRVKAHDYGLANVLLQTGREVASAYGVLGTPSAVLVTAAGRIGSPPAQGHADITSLVDRAARTTEAWRPASETPDGAPFAGPDQPLPDLAWSTLDGREIRLSDFRGRPTVLMFWNPSCGYCRKMLDDLKAWDARPATVRQPMIVVSAGPVTDNEAMGLRSPIVLDQDFAVGRLFGARGTPAAAVVDPTGVWDGHTAVGIPHVRALLASTMGEALPASAVPVRQESVEDELLGDGGMLLYHTTRRQVLTLNGTAALVWDCCDGRHSIDMIVEEVRGVFPSAVSAGQDTRLLIDRLLRDGMISLDTAAGESIASISPRTGASEAR